ncbi:MAG: peptide-methionine (R)-S-oxide reductase [Proteobacteria bacterium]|nr:peptide-methionine (R)-S-oxide reductase [Pseudomonadota bacterium]
MTRRTFIATLLAATAIAAVPRFLVAGDSFKEFAVTKSDEEWKAQLTPEAYKVLRKHGTEPSGTSPLNYEKRKGVFHCAGCDWPLYSSDAKFESGTGWPSFFEPINDKALGLSVDHRLFYPRDEVHCAHCGGHLGHVFDDGPPPTGKRYCMNGVAMTFKPL